MQRVLPQTRGAVNTWSLCCLSSQGVRVSGEVGKGEGFLPLPLLNTHTPGGSVPRCTLYWEPVKTSRFAKGFSRPRSLVPSLCLPLETWPGNVSCPGVETLASATLSHRPGVLDQPEAHPCTLCLGKLRPGMGAELGIRPRWNSGLRIPSPTHSPNC